MAAPERGARAIAAEWHREDHSIYVEPGSGMWVDLSTDGGASWHALGSEEALEMAVALQRSALYVESRR